MIKRYFEHDVGKNAAALAYYLMFAVFPLLIFVSNLLGILKLDIFTVIQLLGKILPADILDLIESYLDHITRSSSSSLMLFSLVFSVWFPLRAVRGLMKDVRRAYGLQRPENKTIYTLKQLVHTVLLLAAVSIILFLSTFGYNLTVKII